MSLPSLCLVSAFFLAVFFPRNSSAYPTLLPHPTDYSSTARLLYFHRHFEFYNDGKESTILNEAFERYATRILENSYPGKNPSSLNHHHRLSKEDAIHSVSVFVVSSDQSLGLQTSETYTLRINAPTTIIQATTVYGALRAMESLAQLSFELKLDDDRLVFVNETSIWDTPRFRHRGLLIDSARHYLPLSTIKSQIDAMEMAKLNVLHWHIVDDQSFPYQSDQLPELSEAGAFSLDQRYSEEDIDEIVQYARARAVRVIPEFDMPSHSESWGKSHPELLTQCDSTKIDDSYESRSGPMDPTKESTYSLLWQLLREVSTRFPDAFIHIGGDEVNFDCWKNNKEITQWMDEHRKDVGDDIRALLPYFINKVVDLVHAAGRESMVWQEALDFSFSSLNSSSSGGGGGGGGKDAAVTTSFPPALRLPSSTVVHVWKWARYLDSMNNALLNAAQEQQQKQQEEQATTPVLGFFRRRRLQIKLSKIDASLHTSPSTGGDNEGKDDEYWLAELAKVTATHRAVLSAPWYLNLAPAGDEHTWERYWNVEPLNFKAISVEQKERVLGGQASVWGELVDETNALQKTWPLAAAVAERLWSDASVQDVGAARERMEEFRCKLVFNRVPAAPIGPGSCLQRS